MFCKILLDQDVLPGDNNYDWKAINKINNNPTNLVSIGSCELPDATSELSRQNIAVVGLYPNFVDQAPNNKLWQDKGFCDNTHMDDGI